MSHAVDIIDSAIEKTKKLLFPFRLGLWLKLALLELLIGSAAPGFNTGYELGGEDFRIYTGRIIAIMVLLILFGLLIAYISSVCTFVFLESALEGRVKLLDGFKKYMGRGLQLLLFRIALGIVTFVVLVSVILPGFILYKTGRMGNLVILIPYLAIAIFLILAAIIIAAIFNSFTVDFVIPIMYRMGGGILGGWKSLLQTIKKEQGQFFFYIILKFLLKIVGGVISLFVILVLLVVFLILFGVPLLLLFIILGAAGLAIPSLGTLSTILIVPLVALGIVIAMLFSYVATFFTLPIPVFFRFYSLLFLEKVHPQVSFGGVRKEEVPKEKPKEEIKPSKYSVY